ncbi:hypothetical protein C1170_09765 [Stutzerimonas frequens]|uniref:Uncharacterized protein n=1 Tax=Stutzerimonas frequens TaxID=2968969 RepID=A0ABX6XU75_9GAMM|nr:hypothetical protein [Stutzerimonas frequens]MCQ4305635.1 hypothetical protein [Stutzerimonas frequens]PNF50473.1 hypothetical protein C1170_09765 [Stutzerimonas frequens]QPT17579.1 hypothetical protein I6G34_19595 [Stutzerimonas frequens]
MKDVSHVHAMARVFRADPGYAAELFNEVLRNGQLDEIINVVRYIEIAFANSAVKDELLR